MDDRCIVFAHGNDWDGVPSRQRYLMDALSHYLPVIYLDGSWDAKGKVTLRNITDRVTVVRGLLRPMVSLKLRNFEAPSRLWGWWHTRWIRRRYRKIIFIDCENWLRPYRFIPHDRLVYDCIDPCFDRSPEVLSEFDEHEREILSVADAVFCTAISLAETARSRHRNVHLINNACSPEEYSSDKLSAAARPVWWPKNNRPIAAYMGSIDWRFDFDFMVSAAQSLPEIDFLIAGNLLGEVAGKAAALQTMPNVTTPGRISVEDGRYLLAHCDIGLIPFTMGEMNDAINPVKMYAYALLGKPMAGTAVRELTCRPEIAVTAVTPEEFAQAISTALSRAACPGEREKLKAFAAENTWEKRAEQAWMVLQTL